MKIIKMDKLKLLLLSSEMDWASEVESESVAENCLADSEMNWSKVINVE